MIDDVATEELARLGRDSNDPGILLSLTAGGNDLLDALAAGQAAGARGAPDRAALHRPGRHRCWRSCPAATLVLTTVYDPTDGTGRLPGGLKSGPAPARMSRPFRPARARPGAGERPYPAGRRTPALSGARRHDEGDRWYWQRNPIEPNARGASEIRRVWLETVARGPGLRFRDPELVWKASPRGPCNPPLPNRGGPRKLRPERWP